MSRETNLWHRRDRDFEQFDRIELVVTPRYKTSGLSGDEWRTSVVVKFWFKGELVHQTHFNGMKGALMYLPVEHDKASCPIPDRVLEIEKTKCDEPGCPDDAIARFELKRLTADNGEWLDMSEQYSRYYRQFCRRHLRRGDCSREDSDDNYIPLDGIGPDGSTNVIESPAECAGHVVISNESQIGEAIDAVARKARG